MLYSSRMADFQIMVSVHWRNQHPDSLIVGQDRFQLITEKMVTSFLQSYSAGLQVQVLTIPEASLLVSQSRSPSPTTKPMIIAKHPAIAGSIKAHGELECCQCGHRVGRSGATSRHVLSHWRSCHTQPTSMRYRELTSGQVLIITDFFKLVMKCKARGCHQEFYYSEASALVKAHESMRSHWRTLHKATPEAAEMCSVIRAQETEAFSCRVENCSYWEARIQGWEGRMLEHFHARHDLLLDCLRVEELPGGRELRVQVYPDLGSSLLGHPKGRAQKKTLSVCKSPSVCCCGQSLRSGNETVVIICHFRTYSSQWASVSLWTALESLA